jgi:nicotinamidase-related amidase
MQTNHPRNYALLVVDMQNAYFHNDALQEEQDTLTKGVNELIMLARAHSLPIFNIRTEHQKDIATWTLNMIDDEKGYLFVGDHDSQNVPHLALDDCIEVIKTRDSAFYGTTLLSMLRNHDVTHVIICGVSTHTCILQTASDAYAANLNVILAKNGVASHQPQYHKTALDILRIEYRQAAMTNTELKQYIQDNR